MKKMVNARDTQAMKEGSYVEVAVIVVCGGSFLLYLFNSHAVGKYLHLYVMLVGKILSVFLPGS